CSTGAGRRKRSIGAPPADKVPVILALACVRADGARGEITPKSRRRARSTVVYERMPNPRLLRIAAAVVVALSGACQSSAPPPPATSATPEHGIDVAGMDRSVNPGDDFSSYANGGWQKSTTIPADKAAWGTFGILADQGRQQNAHLIQGVAKGSTTGDARKIGDFYAAYMDEAAIERRGIAPLTPKLDAIAAITSKAALAAAIGATLRADVDPLNNTNFWTEHLFGVF